MLVAVVMLFVVGAMAALSIDVVTIYIARSEAQLAADGAALAAARVLANSGMTSDPNADTDGLGANAQVLASAVAQQVALQNTVGGGNLVAANVTVTFPPFSAAPCATVTNPCVTVRILKDDVPTFFARIWGKQQIPVAATATAEAYNPSTPGGLAFSSSKPVAPRCVKPWLLANRDPSNGGNPIFDAVSGAINPASSLLNFTSTMSLACTGGNCSGPPPGPPPIWKYYPGDDATTFPHPTTSLPSCLVPLTTNYQESVAGCIQTPIVCNATANIDVSPDATRDAETTDAVNCLTHATATLGDADRIDTAAVPTPPPFQFLAGNANPIPGAAGKDVVVSSSLVTVPVFDVASYAPPSNTVQIVGFVQLFLNPDGLATPVVGSVNATVVNLAGCGVSSTGQPILGNGASPVVVRLITPR